MSQSWVVLLRPSANRVYTESAHALLVAELAVLDRCVLGGRLSATEPVRLGGVGYVRFTHHGPDGALDDLDVARLSELSSVYAMFREAPDGGLHPVELTPLQLLDDDLLSIPKYPGKTNELFTHLLLNLTLWASAAGPDLHTRADRARPIRVLDPLCGRGTTLHRALVSGCDADGIDLDSRDFDAHEAFLKTWLRRKRLKHTAQVTPVRRDHQHLGRRLDVEVAPDRETWRSGRHLRLGVVQADTVRAAEIFKAAAYDAVVADAPYGVKHGAQTQGALHRSPVDLVSEALPGWVRLLRPGGALGLSWNTHVAPRETMLGLLADAGLEPLDDGPWRDFGHRVDQAIHRDILVARLR